MRSQPTDTEQRLWDRLRRRQFAGYKFRRQQPLGPYIVDFVCFEQRLVVEVDGGQHALQVAYDAARSAWLGAQGYRVLRFWDDEVLKDTDAVATVIWKTLNPEDVPPP